MGKIFISVTRDDCIYLKEYTSSTNIIISSFVVLLDWKEILKKYVQYTIKIY